MDTENLPHSQLTSSLRAKTSLRLHYQAQVAVIQKQIGTLEEVRLRLGLSARKICQLLMVDPSSWSRWVHRGDECPPHVWRALQWYLTIQEKFPQLDSRYFLGKDVQFLGHEIKTEMYRFQKSIDEGNRKWSEESNRQIQELSIQLEKSVRRESEVMVELRNVQTRQKNLFLILAVTVSSLFLAVIFLMIFAFNRG